MNAQIKSQVLGLSLAAATAVGCLAYERLVKSFSYFTVGFLVSLSYIPFFLISLAFQSDVRADFNRLSGQRGAVIIFLCSGATGPLWYMITRKQSMMVGAIYEIKYILLLALFYIFFGEKPMTVNTFIGICFAVVSVYFISKS